MLRSATRRLTFRIRAGLLRLLCGTEGATAIEYGLIAVGISIAIIATVLSIGSQLSSTFYGSVVSSLSSAR